MKKIFVDTNVIVDFLADRPPFGKHAIQLFDMAEKKQVKLYTSSHAIATTHYLLKKYIDEAALRDLLYALVELVEIVAIDLVLIKKGLRALHKDFEDGLQICAANSIGNIDFIVTRNLKDFKTSEIQALPPNELLSHLDV